MKKYHKHTIPYPNAECDLENLLKWHREPHIDEILEKKRQEKVIEIIKILEKYDKKF